MVVAIAALSLATSSPAWAAPPEFGVEVEAGTTTSMTPYLRNEVITETDRTETDSSGRFKLRPSLADRQAGAGTALAARLVANRIEAGLSLRWFDLHQYEIHHRGQQSVSQERVRPDGTVDDSGVDYERLRPALEDPIGEDRQAQLFVIGLGAGYRFMWPGEPFDIFVPVGGELVLTHVNEDAAPWRLGLEMNSGLGVSIGFLDNVALLLSGRLHALATTHYGRRSDAARRAVAVGESTEDAFFSTMLYGSANLAFQFTIR